MSFENVNVDLVAEALSRLATKAKNDKGLITRFKDALNDSLNMYKYLEHNSIVDDCYEKKCKDDSIKEIFDLTEEQRKTVIQGIPKEVGEEVPEQEKEKAVAVEKRKRKEKQDRTYFIALRDVLEKAIKHNNNSNPEIDTIKRLAQHLTVSSKRKATRRLEKIASNPKNIGRALDTRSFLRRFFDSAIALIKSIAGREKKVEDVKPVEASSLHELGGGGNMKKNEMRTNTSLKSANHKQKSDNTLGRKSTGSWAKVN